MENNAPEGVTAVDLAKFEEFTKQQNLSAVRAAAAKTECDALTADAGPATLKALCEQADSVALGGVVVLPCFVKSCAGFFGEDPKTSLFAAVSYPLGGDTLKVMRCAVRRAVSDGADGVELCMLSYPSAESEFAPFRRKLKSLRRAAYPREFRLVVDCSRVGEDALVKVALCAAECGVSCIRLKNASGLSALARVSSALRGKAAIKADCTSFEDAEELFVLGASFVSFPRAAEVCKERLASAMDPGI